MLPVCGLGAHRKDVVLAADEDHATGNGGRSHQHLAYRVGGERFECRARLDDEHIAVFVGEVQLAISGHWRSGVRATVARETLLVDALAGLHLVCGHNAVVRTDIQQVAVSARRGLVGAAALLAPRDPFARLLTLL